MIYWCEFFFILISFLSGSHASSWKFFLNFFFIFITTRILASTVIITTTKKNCSNNLRRQLILVTTPESGLFNSFNILICLCELWPANWGDKLFKLRVLFHSINLNPQMTTSWCKYCRIVIKFVSFNLVKCR